MGIRSYQVPIGFGKKQKWLEQKRADKKGYPTISNAVFEKLPCAALKQDRVVRLALAYDAYRRARYCATAQHTRDGPNNTGMLQHIPYQFN